MDKAVTGQKRAFGRIGLIVAVSIVVGYGLGDLSSAIGKEKEKERDDSGIAVSQILKKLDQILNAIMIPQTVNLFGVTQNWDKKLPTAERFKVLSAFNNEAVRDNETGLVWEKAPDPGSHFWIHGEAVLTCINKVVGGRKGWRLPSVQELTSLVDPSVSSPGPTLPSGHPFVFNVQPPYQFWTATSYADTPTQYAWDVRFENGNIGVNLKTSADPVWCVRGGGPLESY